MKADSKAQLTIRTSNFELLRIVSMIMIICAHYMFHGGMIDNGTYVNHIFAVFLRIGGKLGVNIFVLISAYFLSVQPFKFERIFRVACECIFYSIVVYLLFIFLSGGGEPGWMTYLHVLFAPIYNSYWFVTAYIGMLVLSPVLNIILDKYLTIGIDGKNKLFFLCVFLFIFFSCLPFIFVESNLFYSDVGWFCYLYLIAGYIRRFYIRQEKKALYFSFIVSILIMWGSVLMITWINNQIDSELIKNNIYMAYKINSPFMFIACISLFLIFKDLIINKHNKIINNIASLTFACYLIHDNLFARDFFWKVLFGTPYFYDKPLWLVLLHLIFCIILIFFLAMVMEMIRISLEKKIMGSKAVIHACGGINQNLRA